MDLYDDLDQRIKWAMDGGRNNPKSAQLLEGKLFVRDRLSLFFDGGLDMEDGLLAGAEKKVPADAVVTGIGSVGGRKVAVIANDISVKAGTWGYQTLLKITRMQELALNLKIPLVYFVDSAGARIDEQKQSYLGRTAWGNIFHNLVQLSGVVPQLCVLFGPSPAGAAYIPGLCDTVIMVDKKATAYVGSPRMARMAIGEDISEEDLGGARMHCTLSGLGDILVKTDEEAIAVAKTYLGYFPASFEQKPSVVEAVANGASVDLTKVIPPDQNVPFDIKALIQGLADDGSFLESKELFAKEMTTAFIRLGGRGVGVIANNSKFKGGVLFNDSCDKAARFIWLCNAFNIPLLFLQDISGYMIGSSVEKAGIIRHGAKLLSAVCEATVPRIAVMVRKAYGGGYLAMSGAPTKPDAMLALPTAKPALVGPEAAINALYFNQIAELPPAERAAFINEKRQEYAKDINVYSAAADPFAAEAVVHPNELRDELIRRFAIYSMKSSQTIRRRNAVHPV
ncbi:carboxyl transferase domain-containing protein [Bradyrhizobium sp. 1]|uniref:acyl-CoA carboxylase subunit beta n=1 Tax=Bradyrhizobium sp. 1 TaxID=241591 RepID=UPI001FFAF566|nr:carboxyl transferase domain-containing protein [Bradyrhizobium sp. 1]MCK1394448.1 acyl-CoA carboxylase subunit beta [Bradyrhizobium sp. 1]